MCFPAAPTDLDAALANSGDAIYFDAVTTDLRKSNIEKAIDAFNAVGARKRLELLAIAAHQHGIKHDRRPVAKADAAIRADRQHRAKEMLIHPDPSGDPIHNDAQAPLRHSCSLPRCETSMASNAGSCRIERAALTARAPCRTLVPK
jgi:hypothetical protein